jgi:gentisate 1,2-dioxygenase
VQLLRPGLKTRSHRHTSLTYYYAVAGGGLTRVGDTGLHWGQKDFFVVPQWQWHSHENTGDEDALLFSMSDWPLLKPFGFYREEIEGETVSRERSRWLGS